jgi:hypothetical protein
MSKLRVLALAVSMSVLNLVGVIPAQAATFSCGSGGTYTVEDGAVTTNSGCIGAITFPDAVTAIAGNAFQNATSITSITFGPGSMLTSIGAFAFAGATSLETVTFGPDSLLNSLGAAAFAGANHLTGIVIPNGVTIIEAFTFDSTTRLASVTISNNVTSIGSSAFNSASALTTIVIPSSVQTIGSDAFSRLPALTSLTFAAGSSLTTIATFAFYRATELPQIIIPASVTTIGDSAFQDASLLESVYFSGLTAPTVGVNAFSAVKSGAKAYIQTGAAGFGEIGTTWNGLLVSSATTAPDAPTIGTATALSPTSASISFTAPTSNGGATIETYTATSTPGTVTGILLQSGNGSVTVTGLTSSTAYTFRVTATNSAGTSSPSSATISITMPASAEELAAQTAAAAAAKAAADLAAQKAAEAKREAEKKAARLGIYNNFIYYNTPTIQMFNIAEIYGVNAKNYYYVTNEIQYLMWKYNNIYSGQDIKALAYLWNYNNNSVMWNYQTNTLVRDESATALSWNLNSTMHVVENVVLKYSIMDSMCQPGIFSQYSGNDLSSVGLIPTEYQSLITYYLRKTPLNQRDDYYKIMGAIQNEIALIQLRELRLSKVLSWNLIYSN